MIIDVIRLLELVPDSNAYKSSRAMNSESNAPWQNLRKGDKIRIVRIPTLFSAPHYHNGDWDETFALYEHLISSGQTLTIDQIDEDGRPWIEYEWTNDDGDLTSNSLSVDDDSWVAVT